LKISISSVVIPSSATTHLTSELNNSMKCKVPLIMSQKSLKAGKVLSRFDLKAQFQLEMIKEVEELL